MNLKFFIHYGLHFIFPIALAMLINKENWIKIWLIFITTMLVDLDHLVAIPIFDAHRCSINFHPLHSYYAILIYVVGVFFSKTRIIAIGLLFHMLTDLIDCFFN